MGKIIILIIGILMGGFLVLFIAQNTATVDVNLVGITVSMSGAFLLLIVLGFGIILGWIIKSLIGTKGNKR